MFIPIKTAKGLRTCGIRTFSTAGNSTYISEQSQTYLSTLLRSTKVSDHDASLRLRHRRTEVQKGTCRISATPPGTMRCEDATPLNQLPPMMNMPQASSCPSFGRNLPILTIFLYQAADSASVLAFCARPLHKHQRTGKPYCSVSKARNTHENRAAHSRQARCDSV
jgi:hypothetical protein